MSKATIEKSKKAVPKVAAKKVAKATVVKTQEVVLTHDLSVPMRLAKEALAIL